MRKIIPKSQNELMVRHLMEMGALRSRRIISAFRATDRKLFVPRAYAASAYLDVPLPTVGESTISQPYTVAIMAEELGPRAGDKILEIGTGSGYNACILARCVGAKGRIISMELDRKVVEFARNNIKRTGARNVIVVEGDGTRGYSELAPYDGIIYTGALPAISGAVLNQLKVGAAIVAPVGRHPQILTSIRRTPTGFIKKELGYFSFVPIVTPH